MKGIVLALTLGVTVALGTGQASAVPFQVTYDGTIRSGYDSTGRFGAPGTDLTGQSVKATYIFDTATPGSNYYSDPGYSELYGGTGWAIPNPLLSAMVTINSVSVSVPSSYYGYTAAYFAPPGSYNDYYVEGNDGAGSYAWFRVSSFTNSYGGPNLYSPFTHLVTTGDTGDGRFVFSNFTDYGFVDVTQVTVSAVSEVPLPATLPLFLGGVGAMAWVARRRKQKLQAAA